MKGKKRNKTVAGVDPGTIVVGVAILENNGVRLRPLELEAVRMPKSWDRPKRLFGIFRRLTELFNHFRPDAVAIEKAFVHKDVRAALAIEAGRTAAILAAMHCGAGITEYAPMQARKAVMAKGNATKAEVRSAIIRMLGHESVYWDNLPLDVSDAAALAVAKANENPVLVELLKRGARI